MRSLGWGRSRSLAQKLLLFLLGRYRLVVLPAGSVDWDKSVVVIVGSQRFVVWCVVQAVVHNEANCCSGGAAQWVLGSAVGDYFIGHTILLCGECVARGCGGEYVVVWC